MDNIGKNILSEIAEEFGTDKKVPVIKINTETKCEKCGKGGATQTGLCLECISKKLANEHRKENSQKKMFQVPTEFDFRSDETGKPLDFLKAPELKQIADRLIQEYPELSHLKDADIDFYWKASGGKSKGRKTLGRCELAKGLVHFHTEADFIIWLGADNCQGSTEYFIEAIIFHELLHARWNDDTDKWCVVGHFYEGFPEEFLRYGTWKQDMEIIKKAADKATQPKLFS